MKPPLDPQLQAQIDQFAKESAALTAFYEQAVGYVASRRLAADLYASTAKRRRRNVLGKVFRLLRRGVRPVQPAADPTIIEGEVIAASTKPIPNDAGTGEATVIVIELP